MKTKTLFTIIAIFSILLSACAAASQSPVAYEARPQVGAEGAAEQESSVRDAVQSLPQAAEPAVEAENVESIHNHSAFAVIENDLR